jgi:hypothetical protein
MDPQRSSSTSSMQSPPATMAWTRVSSLRPGWAAPQSIAEVDEPVGDLLDPQSLRQGRGQQQSGAGHRTLVVEGDPDLVRHDVRGWHRKVSSGSGS